MKNIRLGPVMPGFLTDEVYEILQDKFNVLPIDMKKKRDPVADVQVLFDDCTRNYYSKILLNISKGYSS